MPEYADPASALPDEDIRCAKCGSAMVRRVAKKGKHAGNEFWGCSTFPKCRSTVTVPEVCPFSSAPPEPLSGQSGLLNKARGTADRIWRWRLELDEPDANDRWDPEHRRRVLPYLHDRDKGHCGICGGLMKLKGAHIEHIVPKRFAVFELTSEGMAQQGAYYTSELHRMNNLQVAHARCNRNKGNTPDIRQWRHQTMEPRPVAKSKDGRVLLLPLPEPTHR